MDPIFASTLVTDTLDTLGKFLAWIGVPWWVTAGIGALTALLTLIRFGSAIKVEKASPPVSDGGSKDDQDLPPAQQDPKAKHDLTDGGDAG